MYLLTFVTLYIGVISFIALLFQYVNALYPDQLYYSYISTTDTIRRSMASLIIAWPVFLFLTWQLNKETRKEPEKRDLKIRKWLTYLTLFVAAVTIIIDLISLLYNFLGGELTMRFSLKVLSVLIVAVGVFGYYLSDIKQNGLSRNINQIFGITTSLFILIAIVAGFFIIGTPGEQRAKRLDEQRVQDLQMLQSEIIGYWNQKDTLPEQLSDLKNSITGFTPPTDPETGNAYEYTVIEPLTFELCATFTHERNVAEKSPTAPRPIYFDPYQANWDHPAGRHCFERTIDPDLYPKEREKPTPLLD